MGRKSNTWTGTLVVYGGLQTTDARPGTAGYVDQVINETIQTETGRQVLENGLSVVFMFEGAGMSSNTSGRHYGLCVVVRNGDNGVPQIVFQCNDCTSIPDRPLDQTSNPPNGTTVPTLRDGIYGIEIGNHDNESKNTNPVTHDSRYACLTVKPVENNVVRFSSSNHAGTIGYSNQIQIHRRSINGIYESEPYSNSAGCNLIGAVQGSGTTRYSNKFNEFMYRVGVCDTLVEDQAIPSTSKRGDIGIYVVDRTLARDYLIELYGEEGANKIMRITK